MTTISFTFTFTLDQTQVVARSLVKHEIQRRLAKASREHVNREAAQSITDPTFHEPIASVLIALVEEQRGSYVTDLLQNAWDLLRDGAREAGLPAITHPNYVDGWFQVLRRQGSPLSEAQVDSLLAMLRP